MTNEEYEFILQDRIAKIQSINAQYDLEHNAYISFSGGKDSTILHYLIDIALPNNKIPRVYDEYIRIGYRLKYYPHEKGIQYNIFDYIGEEQ